MKKNMNLDMYEILEAQNDANANAKSKAILPVALFRDEKGAIFDLEKMAHILTCGCTISGRVGSLHAFIVSLLHEFSSDELKFLMIGGNSMADGTYSSLFLYNKLPHMLCPMVENGKEAMAVLSSLKDEMDRRYKLFSSLKVKNISKFNTKFEKGEIEEEKLVALGFKNTKMPRIVCVIDEYMPLIRDYTKDFTNILVVLLQVARCAGIHIILSTGRPSRNVLTENIKLNICNILCFRVISGIDSKQVLGVKGAEDLEGNAGLLKREKVENIDIYCPSFEEVDAFVGGILDEVQDGTQYDETFLASLEKARQKLDPMLRMAIENILKTGRVNLRSLKDDLGLSAESIESLIFELVDLDALTASYKFSAKKDILQRLIDEDND